MNNKKNRKGFTIVELVIVIAVIAILATVLVPTFGNVISNAKESKALQEVKNAYTVTIANDLSTSEDSDDVVYGHESNIVVVTDGVTVHITPNGEASVVESGTATHTLETNGTLKAVINGGDEG